MTGRRERTKREGTFLESVKSLLQELKKDIATLQTSVADLKLSKHHSDAGANYCDEYCCMADANYYDWNTWFGLGFGEVGDGTGILENCCGTWQPTPMKASEVDTNAANNSVDRHSLLAYRLVQSESSEPDEIPSLSVAYIGNRHSQSRHAQAALTIQRYYRKYLKTICLQSAWLPIEEFSVAVGVHHGVKHVKQRFAENGCRDFDLGFWFRLRLEPQGEDDLDAEVWGEQQCKQWLLDTLQGAENAPTLAGGAQCIIKAWITARRQMLPSVRQVMAARILEHIQFFRKLILQGEKKTVDAKGENLASDVHAISNQAKLQTGDDDKERERALALFEKRLVGMFDFIDAVDSGSIELPKPVRDLTYGAIKDSYAWFQAGQPTADLISKVDYLDTLMDKVMRQVGRS